MADDKGTQDNPTSSSSSSHDAASGQTTEDAVQNGKDDKKKRQIPKRRKVTHACVYCRRSHMTCDDGRPCQRCMKRSIGHLCHDEPKVPAHSSSHSNINASANSANFLALSSLNPPQTTNPHALPMQAYAGQHPNPIPTTPLTFATPQTGHEIAVISDFLENSISNYSDNPPVTATEKFFLTAADPSDGKLADRLTEVINAKYEAGFLKPYNYVNGYARLQRYMDHNMQVVSKQRILNVMGTFRPAFREVAQSLTDIDLILVEEAFERLLLDYDRVFSSMGIPACLWRRTGEIYKGNKEFASLVRVSMESLREGKLCIYELMAEESAVNYWEKYGNIAFDAGQKAVLTSCLLRNPHPDSNNVTSCCFSFTIRRDKYNIPTVIVGNFLPVLLP